MIFYQRKAVPSETFCCSYCCCSCCPCSSYLTCCYSSIELGLGVHSFFLKLSICNQSYTLDFLTVSLHIPGVTAPVTDGWAPTIHPARMLHPPSFTPLGRRKTWLLGHFLSLLPSENEIKPARVFFFLATTNSAWSNSLIFHLESSSFAASSPMSKLKS